MGFPLLLACGTYIRRATRCVLIRIYVYNFIRALYRFECTSMKQNSKTRQRRRQQNSVRRVNIYHYTDYELIFTTFWIFLVDERVMAGDKHLGNNITYVHYINAISTNVGVYTTHRKHWKITRLRNEHFFQYPFWFIFDDEFRIGNP